MPIDVERVAASYERISPRMAAASVTFFSSLETAGPRVSRLFPYDDATKRALAKDLFEIVVAQLPWPRDLNELLERLGRRGLLDRMSAGEVAELGQRLVATLAEFDTSWDTDTENAWATVFMWASNAVRRGARVRSGVSKVR